MASKVRTLVSVSLKDFAIGRKILESFLTNKGWNHETIPVNATLTITVDEVPTGEAKPEGVADVP